MFVSPLCKIYAPPVCKIVRPCLHVENVCTSPLLCGKSLSPEYKQKCDGQTDRRSDLYILYTDDIYDRYDMIIS